MTVFDRDTCNPLPFMNDLRENQSWFAQVIQTKNETHINPEHREQGWVFKNVFPSILLGITLLDFIQKIFCFYQVPKVLLHGDQIVELQLPPPYMIVGRVVLVALQVSFDVDE